MDRFILTDAQWELMAPLCLGKRTDPGRTGSDGRMFVEAVLWIVRTGSPWRDLPPAFGNWNTVAKRFRYWVKAGVFERMFNALSGDPDLEYARWTRRVLLAQKGDPNSGHRPIGWRPEALTDALGRTHSWPAFLDQWHPI